MDDKDDSNLTLKVKCCGIGPIFAYFDEDNDQPNRKWKKSNFYKQRTLSDVQALGKVFSIAVSL